MKTLALVLVLAGVAQPGHAIAGPVPAFVGSARVFVGPAPAAAPDGTGAADPRAADPAPAVTWPDERPEPRASRLAQTPPRTPPAPRVAQKHPQSDSADAPRIDVAVGLSPEAPGSKAERAALDRLARAVAGAKDPPARIRRLRAGAGEARRICRERRDDLVVLIGYVPGRPAPVLLPHDCRLDRALGIRAIEAADDPALVETLWDEHEALVAGGAKERRRWVQLGPRGRGAIIGVVAAAVVGAAIAFLVVGALRKDKVVLTVAP